MENLFERKLLPAQHHWNVCLKLIVKRNFAETPFSKVRSYFNNTSRFGLRTRKTEKLQLHFRRKDSKIYNHQRQVGADLILPSLSCYYIGSTGLSLLQPIPIEITIFADTNTQAHHQLKPNEARFSSSSIYKW